MTEIQEDMKGKFTSFKLRDKSSLDYSNKSIWFICPELKDSEFQNPHVEVGHCETMCSGMQQQDQKGSCGCKHIKECFAYLNQKDTYKVSKIDNIPIPVHTL